MFIYLAMLLVAVSLNTAIQTRWEELRNEQAAARVVVDALRENKLIPVLFYGGCVAYVVRCLTGIALNCRAHSQLVASRIILAEGLVGVLLASLALWREPILQLLEAEEFSTSVLRGLGGFCAALGVAPEAAYRVGLGATVYGLLGAMVASVYLSLNRMPKLKK